MVNKYNQKRSKEELEQYMIFKRRGTIPEVVKGKGSKYNRQRNKIQLNKQLKDF